MVIALVCLSGCLMLGGAVVLSSASLTWRIKKYVDNYAPSYMPEYWELTNRRIGLGMIAAGLLLVFVSAYLG